MNMQTKMYKGEDKMKKQLFYVALILAVLYGICAICTMAFTHPIVLLAISAAGLVCFFLNEKSFRNGNDFLDKLCDKH